ncbi:MAG: DUF4013 domain-containing protein [Planctomycetota bacterium]
MQTGLAEETHVRDSIDVAGLPAPASLTTESNSVDASNIPYDAAETQDESEQNFRRGWIRRVIGGTFGFFGGCFNLVSLVVCLAVLAAIPILQLIAFGYLLEVSGRLANGVKFSESLPHFRAAGRIGLVATAVFLLALPVQLLAHWESVASLITPDSAQATVLRFGAMAAAGLGVFYLGWALARGGRLWHFLWPQPLKMLRSAWRPSTYAELPDQLWQFTSSLRLPHYFWLGLRGFIGTLVWLVPAIVIITVNRNGADASVGVIFALSLVALGVVLMYLPMLQTHFAAENRLRSMFRLGQIRQLFCFAPLAWLVAMALGLALLPVPLYLLKIEATPQEVVWLPTLFFVAFILPSRLGFGLAMRRARRKLNESQFKKPRGFFAACCRWTSRLAIPAVVGIYLAFVSISQYTSWDGLDTWIQQHAILIPIPFPEGV